MAGVKYWNGSSWQGSAYFGKVRMWDGSQWRVVEVKYAGAAGASSWDIPFGTLDSQAVLVGIYNYNDGMGYYEDYSGYYPGYSAGSISDGTSNIYGGATISNLYWIDQNGTQYVVFELIGSQPNSGWTTMNINGNSYSRASASYVNGGTYTQWVWGVGFNPFYGLWGSTINVTWA